MGNLKPLVIGELVVPKPIIQGGMGVGISLSSLAGSVAKAGGMGIISTAQIGFREPDFADHSLEANLRAIGKEFKKAREISPEGVIGFNIMVATKNYAMYVKEAVKAGADIIISGAGLPVSLPAHLAEAAAETGTKVKTKIAPIVSSVKSAMVILKMWDRKFGRVPDLVVVEGPLAGGHLGFSRESLTELGVDTPDVEHTFHQDAYDEEVKGIISLVGEYAQKYQTKIPVVTAGGIYSHEDVMHQIELGADGVQVATRFVTTVECDAPDAFKQAYIQSSKEDIVITKSPVGMPGRAIHNSFLSGVSQTPFKLEHCYQCLEKCDKKTIPYCITKALVNSAEGHTDEGLVFCGSNAFRAERMETVEEVMESLVGE
ncbi:NAD(P)H-dependent flavin oxidoreductase [Hungatella effluvii]|uniref:NAD(P)H-dependent flavin oxidoreductase n=1 Tax=Hungatella effluvii TaxID=1096246 RepID=UPI0022E5BEC7|nr:nitronate monooxygenase family protein [Hungatella effluvii]